jgi:nucleotide-binding universal stress UspA family protein
MRKILVAVDGHPHAKKIVETSIDLAKAMSAKIILVYVITEKSVPIKYRDSHGDALPEHYTEDVFERTVGALRDDIASAKVEYEGIVGQGDPKKFIIKTAESREADLIVVGVRGLRRLSRIKALGDVARSVIEESKIPVTAVP